MTDKGRPMELRISARTVEGKCCQCGDTYAAARSREGTQAVNQWCWQHECGTTQEWALERRRKTRELLQAIAGQEQPASEEPDIIEGEIVEDQ